MSDAPSGAAGERLQKVLARAGVGSRRVCDDLVGARRVTVNGAVAVPGTRVDPERDRVAVDGIPVTVRPGTVYYLLNKPAGVVSTARDPQGRPTVVGLVPDEPRVFPVGRLDIDTEGLLLLTNDGEFANVVAHPRHGVEKVYLAETDGVPDAAALRALRSGVMLDDGMTAPARVTVKQTLGRRAQVELAVHEGRNRIVRRMFEAVGHRVRRLVRTRIGPIADPALPPGAWRSLTPAEVRAVLGEAHGTGGGSPAAQG